MTLEEALVIVETALGQETLSNVQELVFRQAWESKTYVMFQSSMGVLGKAAYVLPGSQSPANFAHSTRSGYATGNFKS